MLQHGYCQKWLVVAVASYTAVTMFKQGLVKEIGAVQGTNQVTFNLSNT
ncbi:hypothetical protein Q5M85_04000 [Paraclostridium bifermentans]|nr:hypothetical protein [Paraclostridium bifermentans]